MASLWKEFSSSGSFGIPKDGYFVNGAAAGTVELGPGETKEVTIVLGWYFPNRDFLGLQEGECCEWGVGGIGDKRMCVFVIGVGECVIGVWMIWLCVDVL